MTVMRRRRCVWVVLLLVLVCGAARLAAQTTHYIQWDPNPASDNVTFYTLTFDGTVFTVPPTVDTTCACVQQAVAVTAGSHTASITATNVWGTSLPTVLTFNANPAGKVVNVRVK